MGFSSGLDGKESACSVGDLDSIPESERSPGEGNGYLLQYSFLENSWTEEPGGLQSMGSQRVCFHRVWDVYRLVTENESGPGGMIFLIINYQQLLTSYIYIQDDIWLKKIYIYTHTYTHTHTQTSGFCCKTRNSDMSELTCQHGQVSLRWRTATSLGRTSILLSPRVPIASLSHLCELPGLYKHVSLLPQG